MCVWYAWQDAHLEIQNDSAEHASVHSHSAHLRWDLDLLGAAQALVFLLHALFSPCGEVFLLVLSAAVKGMALCGVDRPV